MVLPPRGGHAWAPVRTGGLGTLRWVDSDRSSTSTIWLEFARHSLPPSAAGSRIPCMAHWVMVRLAVHSLLAAHRKTLSVASCEGSSIMLSTCSGSVASLPIRTTAEAPRVSTKAEAMRCPAQRGRRLAA